MDADKDDCAGEELDDDGDGAENDGGELDDGDGAEEGGDDGGGGDIWFAISDIIRLTFCSFSESVSGETEVLVLASSCLASLLEQDARSCVR